MPTDENIVPPTSSRLDWPEDGTEPLDSCPVCLSKNRRVLHSNLRDRIFLCAPGEWTLNECLACSSAFLDPRPTRETMHLAYKNYYTHEQSERLPPEQLGGVRRLKRILANGYKNWRFGTDLQPASLLGVPVTYLMPSIRALLNRQFRHLPRLATTGCVLDVGFGSGGFLENAKSVGWDVTGVDPDIETVRNARARGLNAVQGDLDTLDGVDSKFDVITMCHVIEHVHDPVASLRACHRLLKPGGLLWIETPNIQSLGHARFKEDWRGLEPPRHLVLFNEASLRWALLQAGFCGIKRLPQPSPCEGIYTLSQRIKDGRDPRIYAPISMKLRVDIGVAKFIEWIRPSRREFIALVSTKPKE